MRDSIAIRHYRRTGVILPDHQSEVAAWLSQRRKEAGRDVV